MPDFEAIAEQSGLGFSAAKVGAMRARPLRVRAILGAAEALSYAAVSGEITPAKAKAELHDTIVAGNDA